MSPTQQAIDCPNPFCAAPTALGLCTTAQADAALLHATSHTASAGTRTVRAQPASAIAQTLFSTQPAVSFIDSFNRIVPARNGPITLAAYSNSTCSQLASGTLTATANPLTSTNGTAP